MRRLEIKPGDEHGELKILRETEASESGKRQVECQCSCGRKVTVRLGHLISGHSSTCGKCGIAFQGKRKTIREWASLFGMNESTLRARLKSGLDISEALKR